MTHLTVMAHEELGRLNSTLQEAAVDFARRFDSAVIGIAGCQPMLMYYAGGFIGDLGEQEQKGMDEAIRAAGAEFRVALSSKVEHVGWRSTTAYGPVLEFVCHEAHAADLILTGVARGDAFDSSQTVNTGSLVLQVGRPVLIRSSRRSRIAAGSGSGGLERHARVTARDRRCASAAEAGSARRARHDRAGRGSRERP
jgi:hypothetical protein